MKLSEISDHLLLSTGQFVLGDMATVGLDPAKLFRMVRPVLAVYSNYRPVPYMVQVTKANTILFPKPMMINSVISAVMPAMVMIGNMAPTGTTPFTYNPSTGMLAVGTFVFPAEASGVSSHDYLLEYDPADATLLADADFPTITYMDNEFLALVQGRFMQAIGMSRRAFTLTDMAIETDASDLVSEGKELYSETLAELAENTNDWHLGLKL